MADVFEMLAAYEDASSRMKKRANSTSPVHCAAVPNSGAGHPEMITCTPPAKAAASGL
jgi:hypothetical protein